MFWSAMTCGLVWVCITTLEHLEDDERWQDEHHEFTTFFTIQSLTGCATASSTAAGGEVMPPVKVVIITLVLIVIARFMSGEMGAIW
jgi:hypothetical protein